MQRTSLGPLASALHLTTYRSLSLSLSVSLCLCLSLSLSLSLYTPSRVSLCILRQLRAQCVLSRAPAHLYVTCRSATPLRVCMCACRRICLAMYVLVCVYVCVCVYAGTRLCVRLHARMHACTVVYVHLQADVCVRVCVPVHMHARC